MTDLDVALRIRAAVDKSVGQAVGATQKELAQTGAKAAELGKTTKRAAATSAAAIDKTRKSTVELGSATKRVAGEATRQATRQGQAVGRAARETATLGRTTRNTASQTRRLAQDMQRYNSQLARNTRLLGQAAQRQHQLNEAQKKSRMPRHGSGAPGSASGGGSAVGGAIGTVLGATGVRAAFRENYTVEEAATRLGIVINTSPEDRARALAEATRFARTHAQGKDGYFTEAENLQIQETLNSAGLTADVSRVGSAIVEQVALVNKGDVGNTASTLATIYNNMADTLGGSVEDRFGRTGEVLTKAMQAAQVKDFDQYGESFKMGAASARRFNLDLEQTAVLLADLNTSGLEGSMAGTALSATLRQLSKANEELDFGIVRGNDGRLDMIATLEGLREKLADIEDIDERNDVIQELFGDEGARGLQPMMDNLDRIRGMLAEVRASNGQLKQDYASIIDDASTGWKKLRDNFSQLGGTIAASFNDKLDPAFRWASDQLAAANNFFKENKGAGRVAGAIGAVAMGYGGVRIGKAVWDRFAGGKGPAGGKGIAGGLGTAARTIGGKGVIPVYVVNMGRGGFGAGGAAGAGKGGRFGKIGAKLGAAGKVLGKVAAPLAIGIGAVQAIDAASEGDAKGVGSAVGATGGALGGAAAGAAAGAAIGTVVPVIGNAVGALVGGIVGGVAGGFGGEALGEWIGGFFEDDDKEAAAAAAAPVDVTRQGDTYNITVQAMPGESPEALAQRLARELSQQRRRSEREGLYDGD